MLDATFPLRRALAAALLVACAPAPPASAPAAIEAVPAASAEPAAPVAWNVLIYAAIDNDAETDGNFFEFLDGVRAAHDDDPQLRILLYADRSDEYSTNANSLGEDFTGARLYRVRHGACERLSGGAEFPEMAEAEPEPDSADPENLRKFLAWARAQHPARHTLLMLYGHADGRAMCPDEDTGHEMGFAQVTDVVPAELSVDAMALELCFMGGVEVGYQWRPDNGGFSTRYLVSIPNAGPPLDWGRVFARLRSGGADGALDPATLTPEALGALIVEEGGKGREEEMVRRPQRAERLRAEAVRCCDLGLAAAVKQAVDALAVELARADAREVFERDLRGPGPDGLVLNYSNGLLFQDPFVDLHDLATRAAACEALPEAAQDAAAELARAVNACITASWGGSALPRFVPGASGLAITCPAGAGEWARCGWYAPSEVPGVYGRFAWCRDGATPGDGVVQNWFELLDAWFDAPPPDRGVNDYTW
jgi:clostripain